MPATRCRKVHSFRSSTCAAAVGHDDQHLIHPARHNVLQPSSFKSPVTNTSTLQIHLFDIALSPTSPSEPPTKTGESLRVLPGSRIVPPLQLTPTLGPVGMEICYDLRFPEMHRLLVEKGAKVLLFPAAFTVPTGRDHWYTLLMRRLFRLGGERRHARPSRLVERLGWIFASGILGYTRFRYQLTSCFPPQRATAIQYQVYVFAPAQIGEHYPASSTAGSTYPGRTSWGESVAFDPWGRLLGRLPSVDDSSSAAGEEEGEYFVVDLDMPLVDSVRSQIPLAVQMRHDGKSLRLSVSEQ
ncbi:hypothetical protein QFC24_004069 [Naganishia onofrii]|uniref:Uncharacterized protein n=1 Tax=Naganishia onofrii TaxID=1851511 RepID=A0ACC2XGX3_9TREE|nr:hypothetical protein QFC24_004069 [Naganishia onofrii]